MVGRKGRLNCCRRHRTSTSCLRCPQDRRLALQNAREIYRISSARRRETLLTIAADPKRLGADDGFSRGAAHIGVKTSTYILICIASFPAAASARTTIVGSDARNKSFFLPVNVLRSRSGRLFLIYLRRAFQAGRLKFHGEMAGLVQPSAFEALCRSTRMGTKGVMFVKPPFGGPSGF